MRTIVAGSRDITDYRTVERAIESAPWKPSVVISGTARGVDSLGEKWAISREIPVERFPADWFKHGRAAGHLRNKQMAENAEALIAVYDGYSRGTYNMINTAKHHGLKVHVVQVEQEGNNGPGEWEF